MTDPIQEKPPTAKSSPSGRTLFSEKPFTFELFQLWFVTLAFALVFLAANRLGLGSSDPNRVRLIFSTFVIINIAGAFMAFQGWKQVPTRGRAHDLALFLSLALLSAAIANSLDLILWTVGAFPLKSSIYPNIFFVFALVFGVLGIFKLAQLCLVTPGILTAAIFSLLVALFLLIPYKFNSTLFGSISAFENQKEYLFGMLYSFVIAFIGSVCAQIMISSRGFFRLPAQFICAGTIGLSFGCSIYGAQFLVQDTMSVSSSPVHVILGLSYVSIGLGVYRLGNVILEQFQPDLDQIPKLDALFEALGPSIGLKVYEEMTVQLLASQTAQRKAEAEAGVREETIQVLKNEIARRQKAEEELRSARDRAEAGNVAKANFLAMVSHELRTPLTAVIAYGKLLSEENGPLGKRTTPEIREFGTRIVKSGEHLQGLIDNILSFSELEVGHATLKASVFDIASLIEFLEWFVGIQQSRAPHVSFELHHPNKQVQLYSDLLAMKQILINILSNAFKFTQTGKIQLSFDVQGNDLIVTVSDTGIGIPSSQKEHLFQPFFQVSSGKRRRYGGAGLGLAIVKHLIDSLRGSITIDSEEGRGTIVKMTFPEVVRPA